MTCKNDYDGSLSLTCWKNGEVEEHVDMIFKNEDGSSSPTSFKSGEKGNNKDHAGITTNTTTNSGTWGVGASGTGFALVTVPDGDSSPISNEDKAGVMWMLPRGNLRKYAVDDKDPLLVPEYLKDILHYCREKESFLPYFCEKETMALVFSSYMSNQPFINPQMRGVVVDWLIRLQNAFVFDSETAFLAVNLLDRFLANKTTPLKKDLLQLAGISCFLLASKYEEVYHPSLDELAEICANVYPTRSIKESAITIWQSLGFRLSLPTANKFLSLFLTQASLGDVKTSNVARYILEGTLVHYSLLKYRPSQLAAAAFLIACNHTQQVSAFKGITGYEYSAILPVASDVLEAKVNAPEGLLAVQEKFSLEKYGCVANEIFTTII